MKATEQFAEYLDSYRARLKSVMVARGAALAVAVFLLLSVVIAYFAVSSGFSSDILWIGRALMLLVVFAGLFFVFVRPSKRLGKNLAELVESTSPEFDGRIQTLSSAGEENPMRELLAEDALTIAHRNSPEDRISSWQIYVPSAIATAMVLGLILCLIAAPGLMNYSLRHLLAGWVVEDLLPPQSIAVTPGDELVRRGSSLHVRADISGFQPDEASLFVKMDSGDWQEVSMTQLLASETVERSFDFTLFSVREPLTYYVQSMGIRSQNHQVEVVDLPGIKNLAVTYNHPEWTGLAPETLEQGGDIDALPGTGISIEVTTDSPLPAGELVLNGLAQDMEVDEETAVANFTVDADGEYFLAARIGAEQVRMSDNFFIRVLEDQKPDIEFSSPGRDRNATSIEEVATSILVEDDYVLENVELHYAVNGGEWQSVSLSTDERIANLEHTFYLEEIRAWSSGSVANLDIEEFPEAAEPQTEPLVPGDLVAYYAVAEDRSSQNQTDIYFIEVQPFDRRVSRAEQGAGAGMGAGQGASEQEISQRQKEIVISTWNLIREQSEISLEDANDSDDPAQDRIRDSAILLSGLQQSLQEQARSLLETAQSRRIDGDERVGTFIGHIESAIEAMTPASERLAEIDLDTAIQPEQEALQHLLRADAVFNDIQLSLNQGGGGAGAGAGQDLAEMMELEIDFDQNQYETGSQASRESLQQETDDAMRELQELARRQEQLAENLNRARQPTEAQQWQQEMLRRDAEALQERIEQLQRGAQSQQTAQTGGQAGGEDSQQAVAQGEGGQEPVSSELNRRLESALDAMERASEAMRSGDSEQLQQAAGEAQRQLEGAGSQIAADQEASLQQDFVDMAARAEALHQDQARMEDTLLDGVRRAIASAPEGAASVINPFGRDEEWGFAESKREMIADLQRLKEDMQVNADRVRADSPSVSRILDQADRELKESEIAIRMDIAANYMSRGESLYIANSESLVTRSLDELRDRLEEAARAISGGRASETRLDQLLSDIRDGGEALREISQVSGEDNQTDAAERSEELSGQGQAERDAQRQAGTSESENPGSERAGGIAGGGVGNTQWNGWGVAPDGAIGEAETQLGELRAGIGNLVPELRARGMDENQIAEINQLVRELQNASLAGNITSRVDLNRTLTLLEQLQQSVEAGLSSDSGRVRSDSPDAIQLEYREAVAEYYRRLSQDAE